MPIEGAAGEGAAGADDTVVEQEQAGTRQFAVDTLENQRSREIARLAFGVTLTFLVAMAYDWTLAYLAPCFVLPLLQADRAPGLPAVIRILLVTLALMFTCYLVAGFARQFPIVFLLALIPGLFWTFRYSLRGGSKLIVILLLVGFMLLPMVAKASPEVTWEIAASFILNIALALVVTAMMFSFFPAQLMDSPAAPEPVFPPAEIEQQAWIMTLITGSFTWAYFSFDWTNVHTPLYIVVFIGQLSLAHSLTVTKGVLAANLAAGIVAILLYNLVVMAPNFAFLAALSLTVMLVFSRIILSDAPLAKLAGTALSSTLILLGSAMTSQGDDGGDMFLDRLGELGAAALYAVAALYVLGGMRSSDR